MRIVSVIIYLGTIFEMEKKIALDAATTQHFHYVAPSPNIIRSIWLFTKISFWREW